MIEDAVTDMMDSIIAWFYDKLIYLARILLYWLPPDFTSLSREFLGAGQVMGFGFQSLVWASYAIVVVIGGFLVMSHETLQTRYNLREIVPRLVMGMLLTGIVWTILFKAFAINNDVVAAFIAVDITDEGAICTDPGYDYERDGLEGCDWQEGVEHSQFAYWVLFNPSADQEIGLLHLLVALVSIGCLLVLLITSVLRNIALFFVAALAPVGLACHGLPVTEQWAHLWWRMLGACMASSIGQAALIWMYHEVRTDFPTEGDDVQGYSSLTRMIYLVLLVWMIWKVHKEAFRIARGRPVKIPGSRFLGALVMSRMLDRRRRSRRQDIKTPGTIWGTDMRRPPWRRERPENEGGSEKAAVSSREGTDSNGTAGPDRGRPKEGAAGPHSDAGGSGGPGKAPVNPHDRRSVDEEGVEPPAATGTQKDTPSWKQPHPEVADGGFDPAVATASLHGKSDASTSSRPKDTGRIPGSPDTDPGSPPARPGRPDAEPNSAPPRRTGPTASAGPDVSAGREPERGETRPKQFKSKPSNCPEPPEECEVCNYSCTWAQEQQRRENRGWL